MHTVLSGLSSVHKPQGHCASQLSQVFFQKDAFRTLMKQYQASLIIQLTLIIRLAGLNGPWLRKN